MTSSASKAGVFKDGDAHGFERLADSGNLFKQIRRSLCAVGFVRRRRLRRGRWGRGSRKSPPGNRACATDCRRLTMLWKM